MPWRDLLFLSFLLIIIFGGYGWTKDQLWAWQKERDEQAP